MTPKVDDVLATESLATIDFDLRDLARAGSLVVRMARDESERIEAQRLRYEIFFEEMGARPTAEMMASRIDTDAFDPICDHLLALDESLAPGHQVVGTYRLLRQEVAEANRGFYSVDEFDLAPMIERAGTKHRFLEFGRSCVHRDYRSNPIMQLLWRGIANYLAHHGITMMFGCASLAGTDPDKMALPLSFLAQKFRAPDAWHVPAVAKRYVDMNRLPEGSYDERAALKALAPLVKGYLRLGCWIGDGAVIDEPFGTIDVFILLPVIKLPARYASHFLGEGQEKLARVEV
jgi:putative hemolysin